MLSCPSPSRVPSRARRTVLLILPSPPFERPVAIERKKPLQPPTNRLESAVPQPKTPTKSQASHGCLRARAALEAVLSPKDCQSAALAQGFVFSLKTQLVPTASQRAAKNAPFTPAPATSTGGSPPSGSQGSLRIGRVCTSSDRHWLKSRYRRACKHPGCNKGPCGASGIQIYCNARGGVFCRRDAAMAPRPDTNLHPPRRWNRCQIKKNHPDQAPQPTQLGRTVEISGSNPGLSTPTSMLHHLLQGFRASRDP